MFTQPAVPATLQLVKRLERPPRQTLSSGYDLPVSFRVFQGSTDIDAWLRIHEAAFRPVLGAGRPWRRSDFYREFLSKGDWRDGVMWFAQPKQLQPIGTVTWTPSMRNPFLAHIRWLAVVPSWRRQGVALRLLQRAEQSCWEHGSTWATLETLPSWKAAIAFYRACGYSEPD